MGPAKKRHRNRKRKRRVVSDSSSSEEDSSSSSASTSDRVVAVPADTDEDDSDDVSTSSDDHSDLDDTSPKQKRSEPQQRDSPSPQPAVDIPPFIHPGSPESEQALKEKFRKFWMASIAEGFKDDLEEIRKEPNLGPSRLALLIESLASGADVFSSNSADASVNEMEVVLDQLA